MPGHLVHVGAVVICAHGGQAQPLNINPRVRVSGQPIVGQTTVYSIGGCPNNPSGVSPVPCVTAQWIKAALRVRANGIPVLLKDSQAICTPNGTGLNILSQQLRVRGQ